MVESQPSKLLVAGSIPVSRSINVRSARDCGKRDVSCRADDDEASEGGLTAEKVVWG